MERERGLLTGTWVEPIRFLRGLDDIFFLGVGLRDLGRRRLEELWGSSGGGDGGGGGGGLREKERKVVGVVVGWQGVVRGKCEVESDKMLSIVVSLLELIFENFYIYRLV